jgi:hypothetical protein
MEVEWLQDSAMGEDFQQPLATEEYQGVSETPRGTASLQPLSLEEEFQEDSAMEVVIRIQP